MHVKLSKQ